MQASAEHPLVGNEADKLDAQAKAQSDVRVQHENDQIRPRSQDMSFAFRFEPSGPQAAGSDNDDGPIIRRIDGLPPSNFEPPRRREIRTPRMFPQEPVRTRPASVETTADRVPAMEESLLGNETEAAADTSVRRPANVNFSVSAIRAQRMRQPVGVRKPTGIVAKMMIATFVGVTCISSGVTLGLYGPELAHKLQREANLAGVSLSDWLSWPGSGSATPQIQVSKAVASPASNPVQAATPRATNIGYSKPTTQTGSKVFYDRIPPSKPNNTAILKPANAAAAKLSGLAKHLAVPEDLQ